MIEHGPPSDGMENLVQVTLHAGAFARSEDDGGEFTAFGSHGVRLATDRLRIEAAKRMSAVDGDNSVRYRGLRS